jgi:hypothetical protein
MHDEWVEELEKAKESGKRNWRKRVNTPEKLPDDIVTIMSNVYTSMTNKLTGSKVFPDARPLEQVAKEYYSAIEFYS